MTTSPDQTSRNRNWNDVLWRTFRIMLVMTLLFFIAIVWLALIGPGTYAIEGTAQLHMDEMQAELDAARQCWIDAGIWNYTARVERFIALLGGRAENVTVRGTTVAQRECLENEGGFFYCGDSSSHFPAMTVNDLFDTAQQKLDSFADETPANRAGLRFTITCETAPDGSMTISYLTGHAAWTDTEMSIRFLDIRHIPVE